MSKVAITVGPKRYSVITADGEEDKITALGEILNAKYALLGNARAVQETDNLVLASLFLADELEEVRKASEQATQTVEAAQRAAEDALAEKETLRRAEERAREENERLRAELSELREASRNQDDLFGDGAAASDFADKLDALATRAEAAAAALEGTGLEASAASD